MELDRQREILMNRMTGEPMTDKILVEILGDEEFKKSTEPLMAMALKFLLEFYLDNKK